VPGKQISVKTTESAFPMTVTRTATASASGWTQVHETVETPPAGFLRVAPPLLQQMVQRNLRRDHGRLKRLLETGQT
ncbi:MAG: hypothetical protein ACRDZ3_05245, partial [Acidimicrobiia bacterium]